MQYEKQNNHSKNKGKLHHLDGSSIRYMGISCLIWGPAHCSVSRTEAHASQ